MKRRDFLLMRMDGSERVADLSCEKLFMNYQDLNSGFQQSNEESGTLEDADWWAGEPTLNIHSVDPETFFTSVLVDLKGISKVQVQDMEWLAQGEFRVRVETLLTAFKAGGGEVSYKATQESITAEIE